MFNNHLLSDIKFTFPDNDKIIPAHKYVLAVSSPVFFAMFYGDLAKTRDSIEITDCDQDTFLSFLRYIYCDKAIFKDTDIAVKVMLLADKYDVPSLTSKIVKYLDGETDPRSAFDLLTLARQFNDEGLERACWDVIQYNASTIATSDSFLNVEYDLLFSFVQRSSLRIAETTLFQALDRWAAKRCEEAGVVADGVRKREVLGEDLLRHVVFPLMQPREFSDVVLPKGILTKDEVIDVFKYFSKVPVEGGIKFSVHPREARTHPLLSFNILDSRTKSSFRGEKNDTKLTFVARKDAFLWGLRFLFELGDRCRSIRLSLLCRGEKMKELKATHRDSLTYPRISSKEEQTNVFFNRPIQLNGGTCYTIEVLKASSRQKKFCVRGCTSAYTGQSDYLPFKYGGCYIEEIPRSKNEYCGLISSLLYTDAS